MIRVFLHIPKTGGTNISLPMVNRKDAHVVDPFIPKGWLALADWPVERWLETRMLCGHMPFGVHHIAPPEHLRFQYVTVLRNPVDRLLSDYGKLGTLPWDESLRYAPELVNAEQEQIVQWTRGEPAPCSLERFIELPYHRNLQCRLLAGTCEYGCDDEIEGDARLNLAEMRWTTTEQLSEAGPELWPEVDFEPRKNENRRRIEWQDVEPRLIDRILELNRYDLELWRAASEGKL